MNSLAFKSRNIKKVLQSINKRLISALNITGDKAKENYAVLNPYINFNEIFRYADSMKENIKRRKLNIDFDTVEKKYKIYKNIIQDKEKLEANRDKVAENLRSSTKSGNIRIKDLENLKNQGKILRNELKLLKENLNTIENDFVNDVLHFPNILHENCPYEHDKILYREEIQKESLGQTANSHLSANNLIDFKDSTCYYLLNEAANFDLEFPLNCTEFFVENGYTQIANPDFARKILLEAVYSDNIEKYEEILEEEDGPKKINTLHLSGGGSFINFLGYLAKLSIFSSVLPIKLVSFGRQYNAENSFGSNDKGLFTAMQSNTIQLLAATVNDDTANYEMENMLNLAVDIYKKLGIHFRIIYNKVDQILPSESLRASIQIFSPFLNEYIEVGHISNYNDYVSKRLLFNIKHGKNHKFPHIVGGPVIDVSKIIGCLIENNKTLESPTFKRASTAADDFKSLFKV